MTHFFLRAAIASLGLWLASTMVDGLAFESGGWLILAAVLLGLVNAVVRPLVVLLTLPLTVVTLGLFLLVVNGIMLALVAGLLPGMAIGSFWDAFWGAIIVSVVSWIGSAIVGPRGGIQVTIHRE
ncbi:MAG: phage holin family protein [Gammaproteobacteria bacterium]|nr:phage holin family protein [Gammaproteobacteria bacterium]